MIILLDSWLKQNYKIICCDAVDCLNEWNVAFINGENVVDGGRLKCEVESCVSLDLGKKSTHGYG